MYDTLYNVVYKLEMELILAWYFILEVIRNKTYDWFKFCNCGTCDAGTDSGMVEKKTNIGIETGTGTCYGAGSVFKHDYTGSGPATVGTGT